MHYQASYFKFNVSTLLPMPNLPKRKSYLDYTLDLVEMGVPAITKN